MSYPASFFYRPLSLPSLKGTEGLWGVVTEEAECHSTWYSIQ
jgi:hypothetical protein